MNQLNQPWGTGYVNAFLPTVRAKMYLEHLNTAGYHRIGPLYRQHYPAGLQNAMLFFTLSGEGALSAQGRSHTKLTVFLHCFLVGAYMRPRKFCVVLCSSVFKAMSKKRGDARLSSFQFDKCDSWTYIKRQPDEDKLRE